MDDLIARLQADLIAARKAHDKPRTLLLGTILADVKNRRIEARRDLTEEEARDVLRRGIKRRRESVELYERGQRPELAERERQEADTLQQYLPAAMDESEIRSAVRSAVAAGATTIGGVMSAVLPQLKGRAEGATINRIAREELANPS